MHPRGLVPVPHDRKTMKQVSALALRYSRDEINHRLNLRFSQHFGANCGSIRITSACAAHSVAAQVPPLLFISIGSLVLVVHLITSAAM